MSKVLISVIIPVYNAENYIKETLDSILSQANERVEVIAVDDGSSDKSLEICKLYTDKRNFLVLSQNNQGAPAARNNGLKAAKGKYIYFFDSDDIMEKELFSFLLPLADKNNYDCIIGNYFREKNGLLISEFKKMEKKTTWYSKYMMDPFPGCRIYKKDLIDQYDLKFENIRIGQDLNFNLKFLGVANNVLTVNKYFSKYRYVKTSISNSMDGRILDIRKSILNAAQFYKTHSIKAEKLQLLFLEGLKHINYQMIKIYNINNADIAKKYFVAFKTMRKEITDKMKNIPEIAYIKKRIIVTMLYYYYCFKIKTHIRIIERE